MRAANAAAGSDMITIPNGTYTLTIAGGSEDLAATGDLDITGAVAVVGGGSATTIVQAGTSTGTGIDKVFSVNPSLGASFATSFSNLTMRFGNNTTDGFGGAMDWDAGPSGGTITIDNVVVTNNTLNSGGLGGGGLLFSSAVNQGGGSATITNSTISNNIATAAAGPTTAIGGGIQVGNTPFSMTNVMVTGNTSKNNGGGLFIDPVSSAGAGSSTFTNTTFTGNTTTVANTDGGGIRTQRGLVFNGTTVISNNTATRFGGGISMDVINTSVNLNEATMVGNSAGTTGGAIEVGSITTGNVLNLAFSRVVGNTGGGFTGVATRGGTANMKNNWWGCNGGPSAAPCNTAGTSGGGSVDFTPWLRFTHTASPAAIALGQTSTLTASFLTNSAGTAIAASDLDALIGVPIAFGNAVRGAISGAQATIQSNGTATATFTGTSLGAGSADATVDSGTATASLTISKANTTTTITSDNPDPSVVGQTITVAYTVAPQFSGTPTGTVTVSDGVNSCMATVAAGQCNLALTTAGARTLTATYAGDANFNGSASAGASHQVNQANTTTTITAESADPTNEGETFTVFYAVAVTAPGAGTPAGTVTVGDGVNSCMGTVAAGQCSLALTTAGNRTLTATYAGNASFNGSLSAGEPHTVIALVVNTTTAITSDSPDPSLVGQNVTVSYTVMPQSGSGTPTGNVTVSDGVDSCMATVAAGQCTLAMTTVGARTLTATYAGNANFNGSMSAGEPHTVNQAPAITSANSTTFVVGSNGSFTVTATGSPTPTLSVSGMLPSGVTFTPATGVLSGTPATGTGGTVLRLVFTASNGAGS